MGFFCCSTNPNPGTVPLGPIVVAVVEGAGGSVVVSTPSA